MGSSSMQGALWGHAPPDCAETQKPVAVPLWDVPVIGRAHVPVVPGQAGQRRTEWRAERNTPAC
jgi:hypothetical protein